MDPEKNQTPLTSRERGLSPPRRVPTNARTMKCAGVLVLFFVMIYHAFPTNAPHIERQDTMKTREQLLLSVPNSESALAAGRAYADHPHLAGSQEDFGDAKVILKLFQDEFGIDVPSFEPIFSAGSPESRNATLLLTSPHSAPKKPTAWIDTYYPVLKSPLDRSLDIIANDGAIIWSADLLEDGDPGDDVAHRYRTAVPPFHALSADGDVTGQLVYANYGNKKDYDELVQKGVNLTGKIVLTRYGTNVRGLKLKGAEELGAVGVLIYSDVRDDGVATVKNGFAPYPQGPARNPSAIERGSVEYITVYPGDPTTPGYPAYEDAERQPAANIPSIPSLPISWGNAQRLIEEIGDIYNVDRDGQMSLSGKMSRTKIRLVSHMETKVTPIWNTMASIPGHIKDEVVVIGCHRDAWVMGAVDPISGTVSLREIIRSFGALIKTGWKPLRTIVFASWDAEEFGLIGSVEWGEDFSSWISEHAVAYLNIDVSVSGSQWLSSASPSLATLIKQAATEVPHPFIPGKTLWDARTDVGPYTPANFSSAFGNILPEVDAEFMDRYKKEKLERDEATIGVWPLGSGSDFTIFLQHLGVASADETFARTPFDAVYHYHSIYDTYQWLERYSDAGFLRHVAVAKHMGLLLYRLADSIILPIDTSLYAQELEYYLEKVEVLLSDSDQFLGHGIDLSALTKSIQKLQKASSHLDKEKNKAERYFKKLISHRSGHSRCRKHRSILCRLSVWSRQIFRHFYISSELQESMCHADAWEDYLRHGLGENAVIPSHEATAFKNSWRTSHRKFRRAARKVSKANKKLIGFERGFLSDDGLPGREWYKHLGVAPGKWLGYGATTFPALTEALTYDKNLTLAQHEADRLTKLLDNLALKIQ